MHDKCVTSFRSDVKYGEFENSSCLLVEHRNILDLLAHIFHTAIELKLLGILFFTDLPIIVRISV